MSANQNSNTEKIKVVLTGARPVRVNPEQWPVIAIGIDTWHDNQYDFQANRREKWQIKVRQHEKGCALVYGLYSYTSQWQGEKDIDLRAGLKLAPGEDIIAAINSVAGLMEDALDAEGGEGKTFRRIGSECIADMPAEDLECCA